MMLFKNFLSEIFIYQKRCRMVFRTKYLLAIIIIVISIARPVSPSYAGKNYYASPSGSDRNSGSISSPWKDIEASVIKILPGDVLYLRGGEYIPGYSIYIRKSNGGSPGLYKTIRSYPGEVAELRKYGFLVEGSYIRIERLVFTDGAGVGVEGTGSWIINCSFKGSLSWSMISVSGDDVLVEGNTLEMQGSSMGTQGHGIYLSNGSGAVIRNNKIGGAVAGYGIHVFDQRRSQDARTFFRRIRNAVIEGNTVTGSTQRAGIIAVAYDGAAIDNLTIRNNVVYGNARYGIIVGAQASNISICNNTIYGNGGAPVYLDTNYSGGELSNVTIKNNILDLGGTSGIHHIEATKPRSTFLADTNLYWPGPAKLSGISDPHPVVGDPRFASPGSHDFHLRPGSAAIDRGLKIPGVAFDREGVLRQQRSAIDIGAYEFPRTKR
jgi:hypothetical protein